MSFDHSENNTNKITDRIKALLAMSRDSSSPNEASIALARARKLMDKHQISFLDIELACDSDFETQQFFSPMKVKQQWISLIALSIARLNDCMVSLHRSEKIKRPYYSFKGFQGDAKVCEFMMEYVIEEANKIYKNDRKKFFGLNKKSYMIGFAQALDNRVDEILNLRFEEVSNPGSQSLMIVKKHVVEQRFGAPKTKSIKPEKQDYFSNVLGIRASKSVHLGKFVDS